MSGEQQMTKNILVVGGGVTGMTAALETAAAGFPVHLVEKTGELGGWAAKWHKRIPGRAAADGVANGTNVDLPMPQENDIADMIAAVEANDMITVHLNSTLTKTSGAPGRFAADITTESGSTATENFGAIIQASGWKEFDPSAIPSLGSGNADVVSNVELEALAKAAGDGPIKRPSDGKEVKSVVFVQNAGQASTEEGHLPYHSGIGDLIAIKQAMYFKAPERQGLRHDHPVRQPAHPGCGRRRLLPFRSAGHGDLLQGRGRGSDQRRQRRQGQFQRPDPR